MKKKKEKLLSKYLEKKRKQKKKDLLLSELAKIESKRKANTDNVLMNEKKSNKKNEDTKNLSLENIQKINNIEKRNAEVKELECKNIIDSEINVKQQTNKNCKRAYENDSKYIDIEGNKESTCKNFSEKSNTVFEKKNNDTEEVFMFDTRNLVCRSTADKEAIKASEKDFCTKQACNTHDSQLLGCSDEKKSNIEDFSCTSNASNESDKRFGDRITKGLEPVCNHTTVNRMYTPIEYEENRQNLAVFDVKEEILAKIKEFSVVIIKGNTGCGKTTQIPQFLHQHGYRKFIGVTQPRRLSTISVANRINTEMRKNACGYKIRYESTINDRTEIKIITDGILLSEIQADFLLMEYSVIILDEVHENTANMELLISLLSKIIKIRKQKNNELKLILMSATVNFTDLSGFFDYVAVVEIPSSCYKVSVFYEDKDPFDFVLSACNRICKLLKKSIESENNSILCFLPDKASISSLTKLLHDRCKNCVILPLHSSLSKYEQSLIYKDFNNQKVILATNIAETSITIPDVYYVVDSGLAKHRVIGESNVIEYVVQYISKSSALQRTGRAGRTGPGVCYRLYSGTTFLRFNDSDEPKIMYEPLNEIILYLLKLGINNIYKFPFVHKPASEKIKSSLLELIRIGVLDNKHQLTSLGDLVSKLSIPIRIAKILCMNISNDVLSELIDIASILSTNYEFNRNQSTETYYINESSDVIAALKILRDYENSTSKEEFCKSLGVNLHGLQEIIKMRKYLLEKLGFVHYKHSVLTCDVKNEIIKAICTAYLDKLAVPFEKAYCYKQRLLFVSGYSIDVKNDDFISFQYIVKGKKKLYMRNITVVDKNLFYK